MAELGAVDTPSPSMVRDFRRFLLFALPPFHRATARATPMRASMRHRKHINGYPKGARPTNVPSPRSHFLARTGPLECGAKSEPKIRKSAFAGVVQW